MASAFRGHTRYYCALHWAIGLRPHRGQLRPALAAISARDLRSLWARSLFLVLPDQETGAPGPRHRHRGGARVRARMSLRRSFRRSRASSLSGPTGCRSAIVPVRNRRSTSSSAASVSCSCSRRRGGVSDGRCRFLPRCSCSTACSARTFRRGSSRIAAIPSSAIVAQTFLHSQGVFGIALNVMFTYVFLFVLLGAFLEATGATRVHRRVRAATFQKTPPAAPPKWRFSAVGLMGSLSGSAVAKHRDDGHVHDPDDAEHRLQTAHCRGRHRGGELGRGVGASGDGARART